MRKIALIAGFLIAGITVSAQRKHSSSSTIFQVQPDLKQISLWGNAIPDGPGPQGAEKMTDKGSVTNVSNPRLIVHQPAKPNGTAILVISGGGYAHIELGKESTPVASWLQSQSITAFELVYRLPQENWKTTHVPFQDAQRAMRLIRSLAAQYRINPDKIGILGFSAGGHLAGMTAAQPDKKHYKAIDAIDALSAKPDFAGLIYPVLTMLPPYNKTHAKKSILGEDPTTKQEEAYSVELQVSSSMSATFLAQAIDDPISPVNNSYLMNAALKKAGVPAEMHIFPTGGHGWGMGKKDSPVSAWPDLFQNWLKAKGF
ncbi:alpha/beta hydrolase [Pedobacter cryoconitis]|uniref:Acetyl esterase/lipase n=1 Tax=Pedobacter cryoconitis TaxID=188932 RepID=A0A327SSG5_9SPHI|nr:alpha/beta hydrolase [Pedobacter cryoconitis]RAJ31808.1 acetyl esterase/lipase [Pedobacter cryoconitis]